MKRVFFIILLLPCFCFGQNQFAKIYDLQAGPAVYNRGFIINMADGGYGLYCLPDPGQLKGAIIRTDDNGNVAWAKAVDVLPAGGRISIAPTQDNGIVLGYTALSNKPLLVKMDNAGLIQWARVYNPNSSIIYYPRGVIALNDGYAISGHLYDTILVPELYIVRTDLSGNMLWGRRYDLNGAFSHQVTYYSIQTSDKGLLLAASTGLSNPDLLLCKTDSMGALLWAKTYPSPLGAEPMYVIEAANEDIVVTGRTHSWGVNTQWDIFLMRFTKTGDFIWGNTYGGAEPDEGYWVGETQDGGFILCTEPESFTPPASQTALLKTDNLGNVEWMKTIRNTTSFPFGAVQNPDGGVTIFGIDGDHFTASEPLTLIRTDSTYTTTCDELLVTPQVNNINTTGVSLGTSSSFSGDSVLSIIDSTFTLTRNDLCPNVGIMPSSDNHHMLFYPNPTTGIFTVQGTAGEIQVYDLFGRLVLHTNKAQIDMSSYPAGIYMVRAGEAVRKLILR